MSGLMQTPPTVNHYLENSGEQLLGKEKVGFGFQFRGSRLGDPVSLTIQDWVALPSLRVVEGKSQSELGWTGMQGTHSFQCHPDSTAT